MKTSKLRVTGLCVGNSPWPGEFPAQMASNAENVMTSSWLCVFLFGTDKLYPYPSSHFTGACRGNDCPGANEATRKILANRSYEPITHALI